MSGRLTVIFLLTLIPLAGCATTDSLIEAASKGDLASVQTLLAKGADPNAQAENGATALMNAVQSGHTASVEVLKNPGLAPDKQTR